MKNYLVLLLICCSGFAQGKTLPCDFEITFTVNLVDEIERCSYMFLVSEETEDFYYTVRGKTVTLTGRMYYYEGSDVDFPLLWVQKKIKGEEYMQGVNNCYFYFRDLAWSSKIKLNLGVLCPIEQTLVAIYEKDKVLRCVDFIPDSIPTWRLHLKIVDFKLKK